jgi:hypothetical protein
MAMSRADFRLLARFFKKFHARYPHRESATAMLLEDLCKELSEAYPNFDKEEFLRYIGSEVKT